MAAGLQQKPHRIGSLTETSTEIINHPIQQENAALQSVNATARFRITVPVAAVDVEQNDDEAQEITSEVGAAEEPGEPPRTMLPSRHLGGDRRGNGNKVMLLQSETLLFVFGLLQNVFIEYIAC